MQGPDWVGEEFAALVQERRGQRVQSSQRRQEPGDLTLHQELCVRPRSGLEALCGYVFIFVSRGRATSTLPGYCVD